MGSKTWKYSWQRCFDPTFHDLDASFRLTNFADLKGWGCKVPREVLLNLLEGLSDDSHQHESKNSLFRVGKYAWVWQVFLKSLKAEAEWSSPFIIGVTGIGMDSSITPLRNGNTFLVQTTDFFYPLVEDPYMQGMQIHLTNSIKKIDFLNKCFLLALSRRKNCLCQCPQRPVCHGCYRLRQHAYALGGQHQDDWTRARHRRPPHDKGLQGLRQRGGHERHRRSDCLKSVVHNRRRRDFCLHNQWIHHVGRTLNDDIPDAITGCYFFLCSTHRFGLT